MSGFEECCGGSDEHPPQHTQDCDEISIHVRTEAVAAMPHVKKWLTRLRRVARDMPPEVWVFVASGTPCVMAHDEAGKPYMKSDDGVDQDALVESLSGKRGTWDGGDW